MGQWDCVLDFILFITFHYYKFKPCLFALKTAIKEILTNKWPAYIALAHIKVTENAQRF